MGISLNSVYSFASRWLFSTNYKYIGILYINFGHFSRILRPTILMIFLILIVNYQLYFVSICEGVDHSTEEVLFSPYTWDILCKVAFGCAIVGGVAITGYGLYYFCGSSYGASCYAAVFGTSSSSAVLKASSNLPSDDIVTKKMINFNNSVVQLVDPTTSQVLHTTSFHSWRQMMGDCSYMDPFTSDLQGITLSLDYFIRARSILNKIDYKIFFDWKIVDVDQIVRYIDPNNQIVWFQTTMDNHSVDVAKLYQSFYEGVTKELAAATIEEFEKCSLDVSYNVLERSGVLPVITDASVNTLMEVVAKIYLS